jgi:hypothetical protein
MKERDCEKVGRSLITIVLKFKRNINQNYWLWKIALHRFLCRDGRDDPKGAKED